MPSPARILEYFAELAPVGRGPRWNHAPGAGALVSLPQPWDVRSDDGGPLVVESGAARLTELSAAARIHGSRDFLRLGWMFISGTCDISGKPTRVFVPVASAPVQLCREPGSRNRLRYQVTADADFAVPESLFPDHKIRHRLNARLEDLASAEVLRMSPADSWSRLEAFVDEFCDGAGLPRIATVLAAGSPITPTSGPLSAHPGLAVYTSRDQTAINLESTLRDWGRQQLHQTALASVYGNDGDTIAPVLDGAVANSLPLNRIQEWAILMARALPVTVLSGPPGTGKTHTAIAMAIDQIAHGKSVLIVAHSDDAVDAIEAMLARYSSPRHVRFGSRSSRKRTAAELSAGLEADPARTLPAAAPRLDAMEAKLEQSQLAVRRRLEMEEDFSRALVVRTTNSWCLADAPGLTRVLASAALSGDLRRLVEQRTSGGFLGPIRRARAAGRLTALLEVAPSRLDELVGPVLTLVEAEEAVHAAQAASSLSVEAAFSALEEVNKEARSEFGRQVEAMRSGRSWAPGVSRAVALLATALRSGRAPRRDALQNIDSRAVLEALPLWIGTLADVDDVLPLRPAMFDVVVVDEASQVNQVRAATTLARARRTAIIGDPQQLRHVSFVGDAKMRVAAGKVDINEALPLLDVRRNSLFDVAAATTPVLQLTEHYRSAPHLITFSGRHFYGGQLRLMTEHPAISRSDVIEVVRVAGSRAASGVVAEEAEFILGRVAEQAAAGGRSIGVVTPFRAQADAMVRLARDRFSPDEVEHMGLRIGTVHGFQGNERDHVFISLALDPGDLRPLRFVEDPNLFNVMVTRARTELVVVLSVDPDELPEGLLLSYIRHAAAAPSGPKSDPHPAPGWRSAVAAALRPFGLPMWENFQVGGFKVDIAIGEGAGAIGVECGIHPDGVDAHMARHSALRRAGWDLMTVMESQYLARPEDAAEAIVRRVVRRDSSPVPLGGPQSPPQSPPNDPGGQ